ncbi:MAG: hypothetical protein KGI38_07065 [Thaumarchaeota archaeon]|nr:hypothetical protein [Nitrososphaerota archaeon]
MRQSLSGTKEETRANEWYVPKHGPRKIRLLVGLSFYPYSLMNASYVLLGSLLATPVHFDRMAGMALVYLLAVGVSAHSLDALAPNKPWGNFLTRRQLLILAIAALVPALGLGLFYALAYAPLLLPLGVAEIFFLLAYNLELFGGKFHTDFWFAASWGFLPVLAGYAVQTDSLSLSSLAGGLFGFFTAFVEINASRPYKALKRDPHGESSEVASRLESILKGIVATVLAAAAALLMLRLFA